MRCAAKFAGSFVLLAVGLLSCGATDNVIGSMMRDDLPGVAGGPNGSAGQEAEAGGAAGASGEAGFADPTSGAGGTKSVGEDLLGQAGAIDVNGVSDSSSAGAAGADAVLSSESDCVIRVATTGSDSNTGHSFGSAFRTVQRGLAAASALAHAGVCPSVEVWVAAGTYQPTASADRTESFQLVPAVALFGGFGGSESTRAERDFAQNLTILSGEIGTSDPSDNSFHVVTGATGATLDGFTITGGYTNEAPFRGAGMYNLSTSPTISNCTFTNNEASAGAGMYNDSSSPTITRCAFSNNTVHFGYGGGMYNDHSSPAITDCTFANNSSQYSGAGMYNANSSPTVSNSMFANNSAVETGGGMDNEHSSPTIMHSTFFANSASFGGGMINNESNFTLTDSVFANNDAYVGGGIYDDSSSPTVTNCIFSGNSVGGSAKFAGSGSAAGGAIFNDASSPVLTNCTFNGNTAAYSGGAIHNSNSSAPIVTNSIFWGDAVGASVSEIADAEASSATAVSHSIVQGGDASGAGSSPSTQSADPRFVDAANGDLHLRSDSPAIDAGNGCASFVTLTDQAGNGRWDVESVANTGNGLDLGALEYQGSPGIDAPITAFVCP